MAEQRQRHRRFNPIEINCLGIGHLFRYHLDFLQRPYFEAVESQTSRTFANKNLCKTEELEVMLCSRNKSSFNVGQEYECGNQMRDLVHCRRGLFKNNARIMQLNKIRYASWRAGDTIPKVIIDWPY